MESSAWIWIGVAVVVVLLFAIAPARMARSKGWPFAVFYVLGVFFLLPAMLIAAFLPDRSR